VDEVRAAADAIYWWMNARPGREVSSRRQRALSPEALAHAARHAAEYDARTYGPEGTTAAIRRRGREAVLAEARRVVAAAAAAADASDRSGPPTWDAEAWFKRWLHTPLPALERRVPRPHLDWEGPGGHDLLVELLRTGAAGPLP
jgi:hypothetical protein